MLAQENCGMFQKIIIYYNMKFSYLLTNNYQSEALTKFGKVCDKKLQEFREKNFIYSNEDNITSFMEKNNIDLKKLTDLDCTLEEDVENFTEKELERFGVRSKEDISEYCRENNISLLKYCYNFL